MLFAKTQCNVRTILLSLLCHDYMDLKMMKPIVFLTFMKDIDSASFWEPDCSSLCTLRAVRVIVDCLCQRHTLKKLVPETCASHFVPETCMCVNQSGTSFSFASFFALSCKQLYSRTETLRHQFSVVFVIYIHLVFTKILRWSGTTMKLVS